MPSSVPAFSVIIPTFNRKDFLAKAVWSVLGQTFRDFELIVIDDGSTDGTEGMVKRLEDPRIRYFYQKNRGVAHARNRGIERAKGPWLAFLDSDDWWRPEKLTRFHDVMAQDREERVFHSQEVWYRRGVLLNQKKAHLKPGGRVYTSALELCCISMSTAVVHREVFDDVGLFDESLPACEDYDFWLRATARYAVRLIDEPLTEKEGGRSDQLSSQWGLDRYRIQSLVKMLKSGILNREECRLTRQVMLKKAGIYINGCQKRGRIQEARRFAQMISCFEPNPEENYANR